MSPPTATLELGQVCYIKGQLLLSWDQIFIRQEGEAHCCESWQE